MKEKKIGEGNLPNLFEKSVRLHAWLGCIFLLKISDGENAATWLGDPFVNTTAGDYAGTDS